MLFGKLLAILRQVFFREFSGGCEMKYYSFLQVVGVELYCVGIVGLNKKNKIQHNIKIFCLGYFHFDEGESCARLEVRRSRCLLANNETLESWFALSVCARKMLKLFFIGFILAVKGVFSWMLV